MNWLDHFEPIRDCFVSNVKQSGKLIDFVRFLDNTEEKLNLTNNSIVVISLQQPILSSFSDSFHMLVRRKFYNLYASLPLGSEIYDLGYHTFTDSSPDILRKMFKDINSLNINVIILSSVNNVNTLLYNTIKKQYKSITIAEVSPELPTTSKTESAGFKKIISDPDNNLFNYTNLGMQAFLNSTANQDLFRKLLFDTIRMGTLQKDISLSEPVIRDSQIFSFDFNSIKVSDAPATDLGNPTGLSGFDACHISRFAGVSEKNRIFCLNRTPLNDDISSASSFMAAQMLWFYTEGFFNRITEKPNSTNKNFNTFLTETEEYGTLTFFQSHISNRWWVQIEISGAKKIIISCLKNDYLDTLKGEIPEKFIKLFQKII